MEFKSFFRVLFFVTVCLRLRLELSISFHFIHPSCTRLRSPSSRKKRTDRQAQARSCSPKEAVVFDAAAKWTMFNASRSCGDSLSILSLFVRVLLKFANPWWTATDCYQVAVNSTFRRTRLLSEDKNGQWICVLSRRRSSRLS